MYRIRSGWLWQIGMAVLLSGACGADQVVDPPPKAADTTRVVVDPAPNAADTTRIVVDNTVTHQTLDGFGGTTLPLVYPNGDHLGAFRAAAIRAAFREVGVSRGMLSIGVVEAPANAADPYGQRGNDNDNPFLLNPAGFNFTGSDILRTAVLTPASAYGFNAPDLGPLISLTGALDWLKPIRAVDYTRYLDEVAEHILAIMQRWRDIYGVTPRLLHLFNEPTSGNIELQSSSAQEVVDIVKRAGGRLRSAGFAEVRFVVPNEETISRSLAVAQAILSDPGARPYVGVIGFHAYPYGSAYSSPRRILEAAGIGIPDPDARAGLEGLKALGQQYGIPVWMTEISEGPGNADYPFDAIENVLARSIHIHDSFIYSGASAYFGMLTLWDSQTHAEHFAGRNVPFLSDNNSIVLVDLGAGGIRLSGMAYAIGHYARWLRPGAVRIAAHSEKPRVLVTAFRDPANQRLVVVTVNNEPTEQLLQITLNGAAASAAITGEASYGSVRWSSIAPFSAAATGKVQYVAPARTVVTLAIPSK